LTFPMRKFLNLQALWRVFLRPDSLPYPYYNDKELIRIIQNRIAFTYAIAVFPVPGWPPIKMALPAIFWSLIIWRIIPAALLASTCRQRKLFRWVQQVEIRRYVLFDRVHFIISPILHPERILAHQPGIQFTAHNNFSTIHPSNCNFSMNFEL
jgi:hypothetical protein